MKYLHFYTKEEDFNKDYWGRDYLEPWVSLTVEDSKRVDYNRSQPLTFTALQNGAILVETRAEQGTNLYLERDIKYAHNGEMHTISLNSATTSSTINVASGDVVYFFGDNDRYCEWNEAAGKDVFVRIISRTGKINISGNIMSLVNSKNWEDEKLDREYSFAYLFSNSEVVSAEDLVLPDKLYPWCISRLFKGCNKLEKAPVLPSKDVEPGCYFEMFHGCPSLTTAPTLPNIETAKTYCYGHMFYGCSNLVNNIPSILPATTLEDYCYFRMFYGCSKITKAPVLPAAEVVSYSYNAMFINCTSLSEITCLATSFTGSGPKSSWVQNVAPNGTFIKSPNITESQWGRGQNGIPTGWTVQDA